MLQTAPASDGAAESRQPLYLDRLLDIYNQIGDDPGLVEVLRWVGVRQREDALAARSSAIAALLWNRE